MSQEISSKYNPAEAEQKWYPYWMEKGFFFSKPDNREPYTIVIPPPNVTGVLHMGHMLNNTIQDVLIRRARMQGKNACWVPGTDHASIATEAKVVNKLKEQGIDKRQIGREKFLEHAWEWTHKHGGIILEQLKKLGASADWNRTTFTMDEGYSESVIGTFVDLFNKGLVYRGNRMVNWDPKALTAVSDEEVNHKEVKSKLYYIQYKLEDNSGNVVIATTRPETILADTAICVNPNDERFKHLIGKKALVPFANRPIPIIADEYVEMEFGTGCLKVTPAHDVNDYNLGLKHNLPIIDMLTADGKVAEIAGFYVGDDRFVARKKIAKDLEANGFLIKTEEITNKVGYSERTDEVIEPRMSMQWFLKMDAMASPALENVLNNNIKFYPEKFKNTYKYWMENIRDWCISRQLWWGHQIPAFYFGQGLNDFVVANTKIEALQLAISKTGNNNLKIEDLRQDEDVLDTWFSSWLWPISVFDGWKNPKNEEINYYYPTNTLVTAPEILFFWVARMVMAGYEYRNDLPFEHVYLTGIVRDKLGRKMSKSLGNSPDPIELIGKYGADGVRVGMLLCSPAGNDILFDEALCEQGRNFANKIWNAFRLVKGWEVDTTLKTPEGNKQSIIWFENKFNQALTEIYDHYEKFRLSDALMAIYKLVWDDYCAWYLEMIKPNYQQPIDSFTFDKTIGFFEDILKLLHPFTPFITEEIWHLIKERSEKDCIIIALEKKPEPFDIHLLSQFDITMQIISNVRQIRNEKGISPKEALALMVSQNEPIPNPEIITKLANISEIKTGTGKIEKALSFIVKGYEMFVPIAANINVEEERKKLQNELEYTQGFLASIMKKLGNEKFVNGAPAQVLENENKKKADAENKIKLLEAQINSL